MTLWRLEVVRLVRTHRWLVLVGVYATFGALGPLTAAYLPEIVAQFGGGVTIDAPAPTAVDGIAQFTSNANQLGLLAVVVIGAGALAVDARPEVAAFLRTRVPQARILLWPRYVVMAAAAVVSLTVGTVVAWIATAALLGAPPAGAMLAGTAFGALYLAFVVAVLAAAGATTASRGAAVLTTIAVLLFLPAFGLVEAVRPWLPSTLLGSITAMVGGVGAGEFVRASVVTALMTAGLLGAAAWGIERREI